MSQAIADVLSLAKRVDNKIYMSDFWSSGPPSAPAQIDDLAATSGPQVLLGWTNNGDATGFRVMRKPFGAADTAYVQLGSDLPGTASSYLDNSGVIDSQYTYRIDAYNAGGIVVGTEASATFVAGSGVILLTEANLLDIEAARAVDPTWLNIMRDQVVMRYANGTVVNFFYQMSVEACLQAILNERDGAPNTNLNNFIRTQVLAQAYPDITNQHAFYGWAWWNPYWVSQFQPGATHPGWGETSVPGAYRTDGRNQFRVSGTRMLLTYHFITEFPELRNLFSAQEYADFQAKVFEILDVWYDWHFDPTKVTLHVQDSDETNSSHSSFHLASMIFPPGALKNRMAEAAADLDVKLDNYYFAPYDEGAESPTRPLVGYCRRGILPESPSYAGGNNNFIVDAAHFRTLQGSPPAYTTYGRDQAQWVLYSMIGTFKGLHRYNDTVGDTTPYALFSNYRVELSTLPGFWQLKGTDEWKAIKWLWENIDHNATSQPWSEWRSPWRFIIGDDGSPSESPDLQGRPRHMIFDGYGTVAFKDAFAAPTIQVIIMAPKSWMVDHVYHPTASLELYWKGVKCSTNADTTGAGAVDKLTPMNNFGVNNEYGYPTDGLPGDIGTPRFGGGVRGMRHLADFSNARFFHSAKDISGAWNYSGNNTITQMTRQTIAMYGAADHAVVIQYDRGVNPTSRTWFKRTRVQSNPVIEGDYRVSTDADGAEHHYRECEAGVTLSIVDENTDLGYTPAYPWTAVHIAPDRHNQIREEKAGTDVEFLSIHVIGDIGLTRPTEGAATTTLGNVKARWVDYNAETLVAVFNRSPETPINSAFTVDLGKVASGARALLTGLDPATLFTAVASGNEIQVTIGSGSSPDASGTLEVVV